MSPPKQRKIAIVGSRSVGMSYFAFVRDEVGDGYMRGKTHWEQGNPRSRYNSWTAISWRAIILRLRIHLARLSSIRGRNMLLKSSILPVRYVRLPKFSEI